MKRILLGLLILGVLAASHVSSLQAQSTAEYYAYVAVNRDDYSAQIHFVNPLNLNQALSIIDLPISENESLYDARLSPTGEWVLLLIDSHINDPNRLNWGGLYPPSTFRLFNLKTHETFDAIKDVSLTPRPKSFNAGGIQNFAWSPDGRYFALSYSIYTVDYSVGVINYVRTGVYLYDIQKRQSIDLTLPTMRHYWLAWSNNSTRLAAYGTQFTPTGRVREAIDIFEVSTTTLLSSIEVFSFAGKVDYFEQPTKICDLRWSNDDRFLSFISDCEPNLGSMVEARLIDFQQRSMTQATHLTPTNVDPSESLFQAVYDSVWISDTKLLLGGQQFEGRMQFAEDGAFVEGIADAFRIQTLMFDATTGQIQRIDTIRRGLWLQANSSLLAYLRYVYPEDMSPNEGAFPRDGVVEIASFDGQSFQVLAYGPSGCNFAWNSSATMLAYTEQEYSMAVGFCYPWAEVFHFLDVTTGMSISYTPAQESVYRLGWLSLQE